MEEKKQKASLWFRKLRDEFCQAFENLDGGSFKRKNWKHKGSGGGEMSVLPVGRSGERCLSRKR